MSDQNDDLLDEARKTALTCSQISKVMGQKVSGVDERSVALLGHQIQLAQTCALIVIAQEMRLGRRQAVRAAATGPARVVRKDIPEPEAD